MKKVLILLSLVMCLTLLSGIDGHPAQMSACSESGRLTVGDVLDQVYIRLNRLEKTAVPMLDTDTADEISQLMTEIHALLEILPKDTLLNPDCQGEGCDMSAEKPSAEKPLEPGSKDTGSSGSKLKPRLSPVPDRYPITDDDFYLLVSELKQEPLRKGRLALMQTSSVTNRYSVEQIVILLQNCLIFDSDRLEALGNLYPACLDPENNYLILECFKTDEAKVKAEEMMQE
ncbi:MAG TPA: DUF4476 domain-containing protein [Candidatus Cloacimonadota bacterium]|nr:DUF4476 domain-containing protein [Candidatus Cloacimonadota bacterium]HPS39765.1 DUF4476 domain-containing protein [Candidatus Cloacimonadota bacterium]